jgi:hypothetical protein
MKKKIALLLFCLFLITSCNNKEKNIKINDFAVVYTSALREKSHLLILNKEQKVKYELPLKEMGIFKIIQNSENKLILPVRYSNKIIKINNQLNKEIAKEETLQFALFYEELNGKEFIVYNYDKQGDINFCTYEIKSNDINLKVRFSGLPRAVTIDTDYAYMYVDDNKKHYLHIIDIKSGEMFKKIPLIHGGSAGDIKKIDNKLIITTLSDSNQERPDRYLISILLNEENRVIYQKLKNESPNKILFNDNYIFLTHWNNNKLSVLDRKTLIEQKYVNVEHPIIQAKIIKNRFYYLFQNQNGGGIDIYEVETWEKKDSIELPQKKDMLVQDFLISQTERRIGNGD